MVSRKSGDSNAARRCRFTRFRTERSDLSGQVPEGCGGLQTVRFSYQNYLLCFPSHHFVVLSLLR